MSKEVNNLDKLDHFAGLAMQALISKPDSMSHSKDRISQESYEVAMHMLKERARYKRWKTEKEQFLSSDLSSSACFGSVIIDSIITKYNLADNTISSIITLTGRELMQVKGLGITLLNGLRYELFRHGLTLSGENHYGIGRLLLRKGHISQDALEVYTYLYKSLSLLFEE